MKTKFQCRLTPALSALSKAAATKTKVQCRLTSALPTLSAAAGSKTRTLQLSLIAATLLALGAIASPARADSGYIDRGGWRNDSHVADRGGWRQDRHEIRQDRRELHSDYRELARDRADFQRAQARGDINGMFREHMEIRQDMREIRRDRAELHRDVRDVRHDRRHDHAGWQVPLRVHWYAGSSWQNHGHHFGW